MKTICIWTQDIDDPETYDTSCSNRHEFLVGDIGGNEYKFCPYCGGKIKEETTPEENYYDHIQEDADREMFDEEGVDRECGDK